jgi:hypothetical protein
MIDMLRDGWRYERRDMLAILALFAVGVGLIIAAIVAAVVAWPDASETERILIAATWAYILGTIRGKRRQNG